MITQIAIVQSDYHANMERFISDVNRELAKHDRVISVVTDIRPSTFTATIVYEVQVKYD